jgi:hypothetical protein
MKYIIFVLLGFIIVILCAPVILVRWDFSGMVTIIDGLGKLCGIDIDLD